MFDDSMIDYMLRMQGRSVSVRMEEKIAKIGDSAVKEKDIGQTLRRRLVKFQESWAPRYSIEGSRARVDLMSFQDNEDQETENYLLISRYANRDMIGRRDATEQDIWSMRLNIPNETEWTTETIGGIGEWTGMRQWARENAHVRINDWIYHKSARLFKLVVGASGEGEWQMVYGRTSPELMRFIALVRDDEFGHDTGWSLATFRSMVFTRAMALDWQLLAKHMMRANEYNFEMYDHGITWAAFNYSNGPSFLWEEWEETHEERPPFPRLNFAEYLYLYSPTRGNPNAWKTHPLSETVARGDRATYDGEWYVYNIPTVNVRSEDVDMVKDFQNFLRKRLTV